MNKAAESAAKWLADKVKGNPKLNPIPYAFFKSIVNKQIEWAAKRGENLDFDELAVAVRSELLKNGIYTMSGSKREAKQERENRSLFDGAEEGAGHEVLPPLTLNLKAGTVISMEVLFRWFSSVFNKAESEKYSELYISARTTQEVGHA